MGLLERDATAGPSFAESGGRGVGRVGPSSLARAGLWRRLGRGDPALVDGSVHGERFGVTADARFGMWRRLVRRGDVCRRRRCVLWDRFVEAGDADRGAALAGGDMGVGERGPRASGSRRFGRACDLVIRSSAGHGDRSGDRRGGNLSRRDPGGGRLDRAPRAGSEVGTSTKPLGGRRRGDGRRGTRLRRSVDVEGAGEVGAGRDHRRVGDDVPRRASCRAGPCAGAHRDRGDARCGIAAVPPQAADRLDRRGGGVTVLSGSFLG